jgi:hypothetical protein
LRETPIITRVRERSQTRTDKGSVVFHLNAETEDGSLLLRLTPDAVHQLSELLKGLPPSVGPPSDLTQLSLLAASGNDFGGVKA